jgi:Flp pilus assembly protein CpaB
MHRPLRFVLRHRRLLAAFAAGWAVFFALTAVTAKPAGQRVIVADRDLNSGTTVRAGDLTTIELPREVVPDHPVGSARDVVGRTTSGAVRRGEVLTDRRTIAAGPLDGYGPDRVLAVVRVSDPSVLALLRPGDTVDIVAVAGDDKPKATLIAKRAAVVTIPKQESSFADGAPVGLAVTSPVALRLAERALDARLAVVASQPR